MNKRLESSIERKVVYAAAHDLGVYSAKMGTNVSTGWPDRMFFIPGGRPLFIEFKRPGGKVSPKQQYIHERLRGWGYKVEVHDSTDDALSSICREVDAARVSARDGEVARRPRRRGPVR